jgi:hypothetical protein
MVARYGGLLALGAPLRICERCDSAVFEQAAEPQMPNGRFCRLCRWDFAQECRREDEHDEYVELLMPDIDIASHRRVTSDWRTFQG